MIDADTLYETDFLRWSEQQAEALARLRSRVRDNDIDWEHLIEEVRDLGGSELARVVGNLTIASAHLLKLARWPDHPAADHWRGEILIFLINARAAFSPSMRQRLDPEFVGRRALRDIEKLRLAGAPPVPLPRNFTPDIDAMLSGELDIDAAVAAIRARAETEQG
jgi:hypothetical protein